VEHTIAQFNEVVKERKISAIESSDADVYIGTSSTIKRLRTAKGTQTGYERQMRFVEKWVLEKFPDSIDSSGKIKLPLPKDAITSFVFLLCKQFLCVNLCSLIRRHIQ